MPEKTNLPDTRPVRSLEEVRALLFTVRGTPALLDRDAAALYGVETKRVNEAVKGNPERFPAGYVLELTSEEIASLEQTRPDFPTLNKSGRGRHTKYPPKAFTEKGLYMLATVLKSPRAIRTAIAVIETFAQLRELGRMVQTAVESAEPEKKTLLQKGGELIGTLLDDGFRTMETETSLELNLALLKIKHTTRRKLKKQN